MSKTSTKPSPKRKKVKPKKEPAALDPYRPFEPGVWAKAQRLAARYTVVSQWLEEEHAYFGRTLEMWYVMSDGPTPQACHEQVMEATTLSIATMLEEGRQPPAPASEEKRTAQVNVRLTVDEKFRIEEASRRAGFRGVSDFVRAAALDKAG